MMIGGLLLVILVVAMAASTCHTVTVNSESQSSRYPNRERNDNGALGQEEASVGFQNQSLSRNLTVDVVFVGYAQEAVNTSIIDSALQKDYELNYSDVMISYRLNMEYSFASELYSLSLRSFVLQNSVNGSDTTSGLNETALQIQKESGTRMSIYVNQSGRAIDAAAVEDWFAQNPYSPSQQAACTFYVLNFTDLDSPDHTLEHWYNVTARNPDTNDVRDFWRAEWENSLNPNVRFPSPGFSSNTRIFYIDPSAFQWYLSWARIWWGLSVSGLKYDYYYNDLDSFLAIHDVNTPEGKSALAQYLAGWIDDLSTNLVSPKGLMQEGSVPLVPLARSMSMQILVLNNASQYGYTNELMSWIINRTFIESTVKDLLPFVDFEVSFRFVDLMDYPAINTILSESIIREENGVTYFWGEKMWEDLINVRGSYFNLAETELVVNSYVFLLNNVSMMFYGREATGAAYQNQVLLFKSVERYFHADGVTPKAGNSLGLVHEGGHDLGFGHTFGAKRFAGDFIADVMGYYGMNNFFSKIRTDLMRRTIDDMRLLDITDKLVQDEYWYNQGPRSAGLDFLFDRIREEIEQVNLSYDKLQYLESYYLLDKVEQLEDMLRSLVMPKPTWSWPMFHHDINHTGYSDSTAPNTNNVLWYYTTGGDVLSSPAVVNGKVYVGSDDSNLYCLDSLTGAKIWNYSTGSWVASSPAVADGKVYVGSSDGKVYCLDATTGTQTWNYATGDWVYSSPSVFNGKVYACSFDYNVYCLNATTGEFIWSYTTGGAMPSSPAVADDRVYVGSHDDNIHCLNASTGAWIWNYTTGDDIRSSPAIADNRVYVGSLDNKLYCLNASSGELLWNYTTGGDIRSCPAVAYGNVYFGSPDAGVYCLNASDGTRLWALATGINVQASPAIAEGKVYVGAYNNVTYCLNASTGAIIWFYVTGGIVYSSPAVVDEKVYVGSTDDRVYAFGPSKARDVAIASVTMSKDTVCQGYSSNVTMTIENRGSNAEAFNVTVYSNTSLVASQVVTLENGSSTAIVFMWNTTGFAKSNYTIWAYVRPIAGEEYRIDNIYVAGAVSVVAIGDINADGYVGIDDIFEVALHFGTETGQPNYDPVCDINDDGYIGIDDIFTAASNFGQEENP
jgi:outer membrane protein assembly factor BamB